MKKVYLAPTDFTEVGENAVNHAATLAKDTGASLIVLHVVSKAEEVSAARAKLTKVAAETSEKFGIETKIEVRIGNIFEDIGNTAAEEDARLIIMGTHGLKGLQYITGSNALKVITNSKAPFVVVQKKQATTPYQNIVMPIDINKETKQKLKFATEMAKYFGSKVHIIVPKESDEFLVNKLERNLAFAKNYLEENGIEFGTEVGDGGAFDKEVISYAVEVDADLITIMNLTEDNLLHLFGNEYEQKIITNEPQIPVMVVNPKSIATFDISFGMS